jgi:hypothetical protein
MSVSTNDLYMQLIENHERSWGTEQYPNRPSLSDLLHRPVVAFWSGDDKSSKTRLIATVHEKVEDLNDILLNMILAGKVAPSSNRRLSRLFVKHQPVKVKGIRLLVSEPE